MHGLLSHTHARMPSRPSRLAASCGTLTASRHPHPCSPCETADKIRICPCAVWNSVQARFTPFRWNRNSPALTLLTMAAETGASTGTEIPKREPTPPTSLGSIPQKRAFDDDHSPAVPSPLNPDVASASELPPPDDASQLKSSKPARAKKDSFKKRETKGGGRDSSPATPDHRSVKDQNNVDSPLRYKLAPPKPSDFELPRGPVMTLHHEVDGLGGRVEFFEASDQ